MYVDKLVEFKSPPLWTYATKYYPRWNLFNTLYTVSFMNGLSIYEIQGYVTVLIFYNLQWKFSAFDQFFKRMKE